jgi:hypothetical protein
MGTDSLGFYHTETAEGKIVDSDHPITRGLAPWALVDETYAMADAGSDSRVPIAYGHPHSMKTIAWTRQLRRSRAVL